MINVNCLLGYSYFISLIKFEEHSHSGQVRKCVCMSPTMEQEQQVSRLVPQRTPPAAAILELVVSPWHGLFLSVGVLSASESHHSPSPIFFLSLFQSRHLPHLHCLLLLSHANTFIWKCEKTSGGQKEEKWRDEPPVEEGAPLHTPPPPLTPSSRYPPQFIWIN